MYVRRTPQRGWTSCIFFCIHGCIDAAPTLSREAQRNTATIEADAAAVSSKKLGLNSVHVRQSLLLANLPEALVDYKGMTRYRDTVVEWLSEYDHELQPQT